MANLKIAQFKRVNSFVRLFLVGPMYPKVMLAPFRLLWKWMAKYLEPRGRVSWGASIAPSEQRAKNQRGFTKAGIIYYISVFSCVKYVFAAKAKTQKWWVILEFMHRNCVLTFASIWNGMTKNVNIATDSCFK